MLERREDSTKLYLDVRVRIVKFDLGKRQKGILLWTEEIVDCGLG
jgi:hypothetical protein